MVMNNQYHDRNATELTDAPKPLFGLPIQVVENTLKILKGLNLDKANEAADKIQDWMSPHAF